MWFVLLVPFLSPVQHRLLARASGQDPPQTLLLSIHARTDSWLSRAHWPHLSGNAALRPASVHGRVPATIPAHDLRPGDPSPQSTCGILGKAGPCGAHWHFRRRQRGPCPGSASGMSTRKIQHQNLFPCCSLADPASSLPGTPMGISTKGRGAPNREDAGLKAFILLC